VVDDYNGFSLKAEVWILSFGLFQFYAHAEENAPMSKEDWSDGWLSESPYCLECAQANTFPPASLSKNFTK
jgi:hypothetical protein